MVGERLFGIGHSLNRTTVKDGDDFVLGKLDVRVLLWYLACGVNNPLDLLEILVGLDVNNIFVVPSFAAWVFSPAVTDSAHALHVL